MKDDIWSKIRNTTQMRKEQAQGTAADLALTKLSIQAELASDYMLLRGLDVQDVVYQQTIESYKNALDITQMRLHGDIAPRICAWRLGRSRPRRVPATRPLQQSRQLLPNGCSND